MCLLRWSLLLSALVACHDPDAPSHPSDPTAFVFEVPPGSNSTSIGPRLEAEGLAPGGWQWRLFVRQHPDEVRCLKAGKFALRRDMSTREALRTLCGAPIPDDVAFTVVEGWRIREIDAALAAGGFITPGAYADLATRKAVDLPFPITSPTLEGYLYPETYKVPPPGRFDAKAFIERQLAQFDALFRSRHEDAIAIRGLHQVVVMASMLEREEPKPAQRPIVAGILWKRLDNGWQLGVDATSRYELEEWNDRRAFLVRLRDPADPYNTRIHKGLPPTAIGNPALPSLEAAVSPVPSDFWYYLHDATGTFHGSRNAAEHEAKRATYNVY